MKRLHAAFARLAICRKRNYPRRQLLQTSASRTLVAVGLLTGSVCLMVPCEVKAQIVRHQVACPTCRIEFVAIAVLGKKSDPARISSFATVASDSRGRFFAFSDDFQLLAFDKAGNFIRAVGRRGDGPGEFSARSGSTFPPKFVVGRGDSLFIFQPPKLVVYSPELTHVRTTAMPTARPIGDAFRLADGTWLYSADIRTPEHIGRMLHVLRPDGSIAKTLGPELAIGPGLPAPRLPVFAPLPDGSILIVDGYSFERWTTDNIRTSEAEVRDVPFLPQPTFVSERGRNGRMVQRTIGSGSAFFLGVDSAGNAWMFGRPPSSLPVDVTEIRPGTLEVVDPRSGKILVSQAMPHPTPLVRNGTLSFSGAYDSSGHLSLTIWRHKFVAK